MQKTLPPLSVILSGENGLVRKFLLFSLSAHIALLGVAALRMPATKISLLRPPSTYSVNLVSTPTFLADVAPVETITKRASLSLNAENLSAINGVFVKSRASLETRAAIEEIQRRVEAGQTPTQTTSGKGQQEQLGELLMEYYSYVGNKIKSNWRLPQWLRTKENTETVITLRIMHDGSLAHAAFERSSGDHHLDESAMRAVQRSAPFSPFPKWVKDDHLDIGIRFNPQEVR